MKKIILLVLCVALGLPIFAQKRSKKNQPDTVYVIVHDTIYHLPKTPQEIMDSMDIANQIEIMQQQHKGLLYKAQAEARKDSVAAIEAQSVLNLAKITAAEAELANQMKVDSINELREAIENTPCLRESLKAPGMICALGISEAEENQGTAQNKAIANAKTALAERYVGVVTSGAKFFATTSESAEEQEKATKMVTLAKEAGRLAIEKHFDVACIRFKEVELGGKYICYVALQADLDKIVNEVVDAVKPYMIDEDLQAYEAQLESEVIKSSAL